MRKPTKSTEIAVSTWSLHRLLGLSYKDVDGGRAATPSWGDGQATLLDIPAQAAERGIGQLEICHFHFPSVEGAYLSELRASLDAAGVRCLTLLIDEGDITNADDAVRSHSIETIRRWIDAAGEAGAERVRVIAGDTPPDPAGDALRLSIDTLRALSRYAADRGVRVVTENWHALLDRPAEVLQLLESLNGEVGLLLDFGNWHGERKYGDLAQIAAWTESTHAKAAYDAAGDIDAGDYGRCLTICADAGFQGPHSLIFDAPGDEWTEIATLRDFVKAAASEMPRP